MRCTSAVSALVLALAFGGAAQGAPQGRPSSAEPQYLQVAGLFGESAEEKAARLAAEKREADQDTAIQTLTQRTSDLERALEQSTSQSEQVLRRVQDLRNTIDKIQKDVDYKLCSITAQLMGVAVTAEGGGLNCDGKASAAGPFGATSTPTARTAYDDGMKLLARAQYDEASAAFRSFIDANPKDDLAPQALYWTGNIAFLKRDYAGAAAVFVEGLKKYPKSGRAPDYMLKLGQSLISMGQQKEGCQTLAAVKIKYPKGAANILSQAASAHKESCK